MGTSSAWLLSCFFHKIPISCDHFFASDTAQGSRFLYTLPAPALESAIALRSPGLSYLEPTIWAPGVLTLVVWFLRLFNRGIKEKRKENANHQLIPILPIQVQDDRICTESVLSSVRVSIFPRPGYRIAGPHATAPPARRGACYSHRFLRKSARYLGFFHVHSTSSAAFLLRCLCDWVKI